MSPPESPSPSATRWPDYRAVWRWHFYAGVFCIPFVVVLAISGAIYLFKAEIEGWSERSYDTLEPSADAALPSAHVSAALAAFPGSTFEGYELPAGPGRAARVVVRTEAGSRRAYVDPKSLAILGSVSERDRFMKQIFRLHGELLMGNRGSNLVELAACWTIVMVLTGLVLWWPRQGRGLAGVVWPRLHGGRRLFWRDMHAVTGVWISLVTLALLFSGLPWAKFWGDSFKAARRWTGTAVARQEWSNDGERSEAAGAAGAARGGEHANHGGHGGGGRRGAVELTAADLAAIDVVAAAVTPLKLDAPVVLAPAPGGKGRWTAKSTTANRPRRVDLVVDGGSGEIVRRDDFATKHPIDKVVAVGIAFHEGRLFGWPNQLLLLLTAAGLVLVCGSAVWLWLRRRDPGRLGAPPPGIPPQRSVPLMATVLALGVVLPLFGLSLLAVLLLERFVLRRVAPVKTFLGLA
jgi:uncharacterized iron-regulated membrane protein